MDTVTPASKTQLFESLRARLFGVAYRMLGSRADAEDVVQESFLRWHVWETDDVKNPEAWLVVAATRIALDRLRKRKVEREKYVGQWLPEPLLATSIEPDAASELASDLSFAFMTLLERLAPEERTAFLLHDVFDIGYTEISSVLGKTESACRQIVHRARERVRRTQKRFDATYEQKEMLVRSFASAVEANDRDTLLNLFTPDATWTGDGGGMVPSSPQPIVGAEKILNLLANIRSKFWKDTWTVEFTAINGEPGLCIWDDGNLTGTLSFATDATTRITEAYAILNPEKLSRASRDSNTPSRLSASQKLLRSNQAR